MPVPTEHRRGFTLIEVLVVIGIILILIGLFFVGMKVIGRSAGSNATKVTLTSLQGMLSELETTGSLTNRQPTFMWVNVGGGTLTNTGPNASGVNPFNIWKDYRPDLPPSPTKIADLTSDPIDVSALGDVSSDQWDASKSSDPQEKRARFQSDAVCNTQLVMQLLLQAQTNRTAFQQFSQENLLKNPDQGKQAVSHAIVSATGPNLILAAATPPAAGAISPAIAVDAFQNPIIFVPAGGMNVAAPYSASESYKQGRIVSNSAKLYRSIKATSGTPTTDTNVWEQLPPNYNPVIASPERRPYFVSAGPDGDFRTPDDNIYSFE